MLLLLAKRLSCLNGNLVLSKESSGRISVMSEKDKWLSSLQAEFDQSCCRISQIKSLFLILLVTFFISVYFFGYVFIPDML
ncbi:hypothetical protein EB796_006288 [Bugula neritina]|uniref:Uncharacterized protein n=1 Tax=Bugula neritina TaxID=10212 RepID=A0A7J7KBU5_BUGNE|nr:hypothetical protein EB796_006288 [Bugula neritina]